MKNNKLKAKKGMTLIEVIISVTLLSILIVPLSGLVMSSLKNNKDSEYRQKASYVGQKVLEELKAYDKITLKNDAGKKYFELLDGDEIKKDLLGDPSGNTFIGSFDRSIYGKPRGTLRAGEEIYKVKVTIKKDENFQYSDNNNLNEYSDADFRLNFLKDGNDKINLDSDPTNKKIEINNNEEIIIELSESLNLNLYKKNDKNSKIEDTKSGLINNKLLLYLDKTYSNINNIEIKNNTSNAMEVHLIKNTDSSAKLSVISGGGNVILYEENEVEKSQIADMYNYTVIVMDEKDKELFRGSSSKNLYIK